MKIQSVVGSFAAILLLTACGSTGTSAQQSASHSRATTPASSASSSSGSDAAPASGSGACTFVRDYGGKGKNVVYRCSGTKLMALPEVRQAIHPDVAVSFSGGGRVVKNNLQSRPVARSFAKNEGDSCERAFINGVRRFQEAAQANNAKRVTDLKSFAAGSDGRFQRRLLPAGQFDCIVATFQSRMTMRGDLAR